MTTDPILHQPDPGTPDVPEIPETVPEPPGPGHQPEHVPEPYRQPGEDPPAPVRGLAPRSRRWIMSLRVDPGSWREIAEAAGRRFASRGMPLPVGSTAGAAPRLAGKTATAIP
ncbi:hypothetical protein [Burkholderia plantarii]|uniref:hypothetical protein n=1 Tax=Burkholderia plantarii TaxID=41899 RepID=UPI0018DECB3B|nr:hypothetical protein [Burkholderia plantarii]MBI0330874.1 hypothetical protein [Burkholderia plantarii]